MKEVVLTCFYTVTNRKVLSKFFFQKKNEMKQKKKFYLNFKNQTYKKPLIQMPPNPMKMMAIGS